MKYLIESDEVGKLEHAKERQEIDLWTVEKKLESKSKKQQKMTLLSEEYPTLYLFILDHFNMTDKIEEYMAQCKSYENDAEKYSLYLHGYFYIWFDKHLDQQRKAGKLKSGDWTNQGVYESEGESSYIGEIDEERKPQGHGVIFRGYWHIEGTFFNGRMHGLGELFCLKFIILQCLVILSLVRISMQENTDMVKDLVNGQLLMIREQKRF